MRNRLLIPAFLFAAFATTAGQAKVSGDPVVVLPSYLTVGPGAILSGGLPEILKSDDAHLIMRPSPVLVSNDAPLRLTVGGNSVNAFPSQLQFSVELRATNAPLAVTIELLNHQAGAWVTFVSSASPTVDTIITFGIPNPSQYITPASGSIAARISWRPTGPVLVYPWTARVDMARWLVWP